MRTRTSNQPTPKIAQAQDDEEAEREVQSFLQALRTYPDCFAQEPQLSFQQHFFRVAAEPPGVPRKASGGIPLWKV
jgi:hypothetical protein